MEVFSGFSPGEGEEGLGGGFAEGLALVAVLVGLFELGDHGVEAWFGPGGNGGAFAAGNGEVGDGLFLFDGDGEGIGSVDDVGMAGGGGGDDRFSNGHVFHEDQVGAALAAVGEESDIGVAVDPGHECVVARGEGDDTGKIEAVMLEDGVHHVEISA